MRAADSAVYVAQADKPFRRSGLPLLVSMAVTFAAVASIAVAGGSWLVRANQYGRTAALVLFGLLGVSLVFPAIAERLSRPLVQMGSRLSNRAGGDGGGVGQSLLLGVATGLLWAPCAGPILGLILVGAAVQGASAHTTLLLLTYAAGAVTSLALALLAGGRVFAAMKRSLGAEEWIRRGLGVAVLVGVVAVAFGLDRGILARVSLASTSGVEQGLLVRFHPRHAGVVTVPGQTLTISDTATPAGLASLQGATTWINSQPLTADSLRGKVVLIDFWTYSCINCLRTLPYVEAWAEKYKSSGLVVIGVHTPEFPFEKDPANVQKAVRDLGIRYPVAMDNEYKIWNGFANEYWPAHYFLDGKGVIRFHHFGEGSYDESERWIQQLLKERDAGASLPGGIAEVTASGAEAAPDMDEVKSPETYVGYERTKGFASPGELNHDDPQRYTIPAKLTLNEWALAGTWIDGGQTAVSVGRAAAWRTAFMRGTCTWCWGRRRRRFRVLLDGKAPGADHGVNTDADGVGTVTKHRLFQLIRQKGQIVDRTFTIEFLDAGAQVSRSLLGERTV